MFSCHSRFTGNPQKLSSGKSKTHTPLLFFRRAQDLAGGTEHGAMDAQVSCPGTKSVLDATSAQDTQNVGLLGPNGLLAIPNVKMLLFMACVSQVSTSCEKL